jgi:hypothetical protein
MSVPEEAGRYMAKRLIVEMTVDVGPKNQYSERLIRERVERAAMAFRRSLEESGMPVMRVQVHAQYTSHMFTVIKGDLFEPVLWVEDDEEESEE